MYIYESDPFYKILEANIIKLIMKIKPYEYLKFLIINLMPVIQFCKLFDPIFLIINTSICRLLFVPLLQVLCNSTSVRNNYNYNNNYSY